MVNNTTNFTFFQQDYNKETKKEEIISGQNVTKDFTWEDIQSLSCLKLGLRHLSSKEAAENEIINGMNDGCSLSLVPQSCEFKDLAERTFEKLDGQEQEVFTRCFENGVNKFINMSTSLDVQIELNKTKVEDYMIKLVDRCAFLLVKYPPFAKPCDQILSTYSGMGRFPKKKVQAASIKLVPSISVKDFGLKNEQLSKTIEEHAEACKYMHMVRDGYRKVILEKIREITSTLNSSEKSEEISVKKDEEKVEIGSFDIY